MAGKPGAMRRKHQDDVRAKIQASQIINRLQKHIDGEVDMTSTQVQAATTLLKKSLPDLAAVEHSGTVDHQHTFADVLERLGSGGA